MVREISWRRFLRGSPSLSGDAAPSSDRGAPAEQGKISLFGHIETAVLKRRSDGLVDPARRAEAEVVVVHGKLIPAMFARLIAKIGFGYAVGCIAEATAGKGVVPLG